MSGQVWTRVLPTGRFVSLETPHCYHKVPQNMKRRCLAGSQVQRTLIPSYAVRCLRTFYSGPRQAAMMDCTNFLIKCGSLWFLFTSCLHTSNISPQLIIYLHPMSTVIRNSTHTWCEIEPPGPFVLANPSTLFEHQHKSDPPKCLATCLVALYHLSTSAHVTFELRWRLLSEPVGTSWHSELIEANLSEVIDFHDLRLQAGRFCKAANVPNEGTQIECRNSDKIFMKVLLNLEPEVR